MIFPLRIFLFLAIAAGLIFLQIFLSKREGRLPGLILPLISFLISLLYPLNMAALPGAASIITLILQLLLVWILANIPTYILLGIYFACRGRLRRKKQLDKMQIQDLD